MDFNVKLETETKKALSQMPTALTTTGESLKSAMEQIKKGLLYTSMIVSAGLIISAIFRGKK